MKVSFLVTMDADEEICSRARVGSVERPEQIMCESIHEIKNNLKKEAKEEAESPQYVSETVDQMRSELLEKNADIDRLKIENEKLKTELAQIQLLVNEKEWKKGTACAPSEPHATVHLSDNTDNTVHPHITGNGYSLDRVEGVLISQGEEKMGTSALDIKISGDPLGEGDTMGHLYASDAFFMRVGRAIDGYLETVTPEKYLNDFCKATYPRKPVLYDELVEEIKKNKSANHEIR